jgi:acyl carrier protein
MYEETIEEKLKQLVADRFSIEKDSITLETSFIEDLNADSLDLVEMVMVLEDEFGIKIPDQEAKGLNNYSAVLDYIKKNYKKTD